MAKNKEIETKKTETKEVKEVYIKPLILETRAKAARRD